MTDDSQITSSLDLYSQELWEQERKVIFGLLQLLMLGLYSDKLPGLSLLRPPSGSGTCVL